MISDPSCDERPLIFVEMTPSQYKVADVNKSAITKVSHNYGRRENRKFAGGKTESK